MKKVTYLIIIILLLILLSGCIPGDGKHTVNKPAGFFWGIWHGWIAPISLIVGLFNPAIKVYESANTGWWYDFGFYMGILGGFGGLSLTRKKRR
ncbi:MAG: hypothetical protein JW996_06220 [Candidatus Cloacimonetes bacterium]|nr:hypothetical protein [Candidatus Cloacimonadota bacterium]